MVDRAQRYYASWADIVTRPNDAELLKWTFQGWVQKKLTDEARVIADLQATYRDSPDRFIQSLIDTETRAFNHIQGKSEPAFIPDISRYRPKTVGRNWAKERLSTLVEQRERFSTFAYWKDPEPIPKSAEYKAMNSVMTALNNQVTKYDRHTTEDWVSPIDALAQYVEDLEALQVFLASARLHNSKSFSNRSTMQTMSALQRLHDQILEKIADRSWAVPIRPWKDPVSFEELEYSLLTMEEYLAKDPKWWDRDHSGVPRIKDDPDVIAASMAGDLEDLAHKRRESLEKMEERFKGKKNSVVLAFIRRERVIWGKTLMAVAQLKRWGAWYGDAAHPDKSPE